MGRYHNRNEWVRWVTVSLRHQGLNPRLAGEGGGQNSDRGELLLACITVSQ